MDVSSELIEKLLHTTGLSCNDLLVRLQQYQSVKTKSSENVDNSTDSGQSEKKNEGDSTTNSESSVILETKSSTVGRGSDDDAANTEIKCNDPNSVALEEALSATNSEEDPQRKDVPLSQENSEEDSQSSVCMTEGDSQSNVCRTEEVALSSEELTHSNARISYVLNAPQSNEYEKSEEGKTQETGFLRKNEDSSSEVLSPGKKGLSIYTQRVEKYTENTNYDGGTEEETRGNNEDTEIEESAYKENERINEIKKKETAAKDSSFNVDTTSIWEKLLDIPNTYKSNRKEKISETLFKKLLQNEKNDYDETSKDGDSPKNAEVFHNSETTTVPAFDIRKSIYCSDHNYSNPELQLETCESSTTEPNTAEEKDVLQSEENLRNILKMQLSSLRNMKKSSGYLPDIKKTSMFFHNLKKKRKSCDKTNVGSSENSREKFTEDTDEKKTDASSNENSLVSQSDDTEFTIVNVTGGVDQLASNPEQRRFAKVSEGQSPDITVNSNIADNFKRDPGINRSVKNSEKSPFISDSLEDFLNESSELRISYSIPKLRAEEGISENTKTSPYDAVADRTPKPEQESTPKEKPKLVKAKTLAEMRRHFEKLKGKRKNSSTSVRYKKKKFKESSSISTVETEDREFDSSRKSFILYNNKKIWLHSQIKEGCLGVVNFKTTKEESKKSIEISPEAKMTPSPRKLSLLASLTKSKTHKVKYKPGPLSRKIRLQNAESQNQWTTEIKILPKIFLEVKPQIRTPIDPAVAHLLPIFDDVIITEERANFALKALESKDPSPEPERFCFHIPFNHKQEKIMVRKAYKPTVPYPESAEKQETDRDPERDITKVIDDLITYVETKQIEDTIIKDDDIVVEPVEKIENKAKVRKGLKRKRLDLELRRLNCKVIDVTEETEDIDCIKPYCRLGCICKSLLCESAFSNHCQLIDCMFECKCPAEPSTDSAPTSNSLSAHTVNHLEDKAKKNLARVEREFTQTVIHTDSDAILVGTAKMRRSSKPPKKYTDFVADDEIFDVPLELPPIKACDVHLEKLPLDDLIPYCLYHKQRSCICKGETLFTSPMKINERYCQSHKSYICSCSSAQLKKSKENPIPKLRIIKTKGSGHQILNESCARIRSVFSEYRERNKSQLYNEKLRIKHLGFRARWLLKSKDKINSSQSDSVINVSESEPAKPNKRKQSFNVREDVFPKYTPINKTEKEFALQRRKKKLKQKPVEESSYNPVFEGEIKLSLKDNKDMLSIIGNQTKLDYLRILPWAKLIESFRSGKISIWGKPNSTTLVCNSAGHLPPKNFFDIRQMKDPTEIIQWVLNDKLPTDRPRNLMHLILTPRNTHFLIAGYCLKKLNEKETPSVSQSVEKTPRAPIAEVQSAIPEDPLRISSDDFVDIYVEDDNGDIVEQGAYLKNSVNKTDTQSVLNYKIGDDSASQSAKKQAAGTKTKRRSKYPKIQPETILEPNKSKIVQPEMQLTPNAKPVPRKKFEMQRSLVKLKSVFNDLITSHPSSEQDPLVNTGNQLSVSPAKKNLVITAPKKQQDDLLKKSEVTKSKISETGLIPSRTLKCTHKDMFNNSKTLIISTAVFEKRRIFLNQEANDFITIPLPQITQDVKWRMIYLNSDFTFLTFVGANYSIKYTDLMDVVKMSTSVKSTIILRNKEFTDGYKHPMFGIFCIPDYQDRLFIGPFLPFEKHNVETLRYLQGRLIDTQIFNKMVGRKISSKSPMWLYEKSSGNTSSVVIDITEDDEVVEVDSDSSLEPEKTFSNLFSSLLCPPFIEELTQEELQAKSNINRYIMTNIPHLGYFDACQRDSRSIEVFWPDGKTGYRFPNVTFAKNLLTQYLSQIFCPVPQDFKINVIIMTNLGVQTNKPIDQKYFSEPGPYFCGEFGICERDSLPDDIIEKCIPTVDAVLKSHRNSEEPEDAMVRLFGLFLMSNEELRKHSEPDKILQWAISEIYILKKLSDNYESEKVDLKNMIDAKSQKIREQRKRKEPPTETGMVPETIEIEDSDEEKHPESPVKQPKLVFQKISTSGRIGAAGINYTQGRSLLKRGLYVARGCSLLKPNDTDVQQQKMSADKPVTISLNNSNVLLNKNKILITKFHAQ